jgi:purine-binding chemotaxis protein CheW
MRGVCSVVRDGSVGAAADLSDTSVPAETWALFLIDEQTYALRIREVERIVRAVEVKPLPDSPPHIRGIVNIQGRVLPVVDLRLRFGRPTRDIRLEDHFVVARTRSLSVVLPVDAALGSWEVSGGSTPDEDDIRAHCVTRAVPLDRDVMYVLDLERVVFADRSPNDLDFASIVAGLESA